MSAHTPGPWRVDAHTNVVAEGGLVAFPGIAAGFDQHANARLIAAAPELLEALKKFIAWSEAEKDHKGTTFWERVEMLRDLDDAAAAAIAKAEGSKA